MTSQNLYKVGESDRRPWGDWCVLDAAPGFAIKRIRVRPKQRLSLQYHHYRSEHWIIVAGTGLMVLGPKTIPVTCGQHIFIPKGAHHRIENTGQEELVFIEVQQGDRLDEADIVRLADDYDRQGA